MKYFLVLVSLLWYNLCFAAGFTVEWGYTPPSAPAVSGYRLYKAGIKIADFPGATTTLGSVTAYTPINGDSFTLTALFIDGTESPHSSPFIFTSTAKGPWIISITLK